MKHRIRHFAKPVVCAAILAGGLMAAPFGTHRASAFLGVCYDDPVITFSNGSQIQLSATIGTEPGHVKGVLYVVHVPADLSVTNIQLFNGPLKHKSIVVPMFDGTDGTYSSDVTVTATDSSTQVLADEQASDGSGWSGDVQVNGFANQDLQLSLSH